MPAFCLGTNPGEDSEDMSQIGPSPSILLTDDTASAKDFLIKLDANLVDLRDNAAADGSLLVLDLAQNSVGIGTAVVATGKSLHIKSSAPAVRLEDSTGSAKSLDIAVDANVAQLRESAGASGSLLALDLTNNRVAIGGATASETFQVWGGRILVKKGILANDNPIEIRDMSDNILGSMRVSDGAGGTGNDLVIRSFEDIHLAPNNSDTTKFTVAASGAVTMLGNATISNTAPSLALTDTTGSAKSLTIAVDANAANLRESAGAAGSRAN